MATKRFKILSTAPTGSSGETLIYNASLGAFEPGAFPVTGADSDWTNASNDTLYTTSSVVISHTRPAAGDEVFFVSGTLDPTGSNTAWSVFGGAVRISGALVVGTGSIVIGDNKIYSTDSPLLFSDSNNPAGFTLSQLATDPGTLDWDLNGALSPTPFTASVGKVHLIATNVTVKFPPAPNDADQMSFIITSGPQTPIAYVLDGQGIAVFNPYLTEFTSSATSTVYSGSGDAYGTFTYKYSSTLGAWFPTERSENMDWRTTMGGQGDGSAAGTMYTRRSIAIGRKIELQLSGAVDERDVTDTFFYVSGTLDPTGSNTAWSVFGGAVRISGALVVGTGSVVIDGNEIRSEGAPLKLVDDNNPNGITLSKIAEQAFPPLFKYVSASQVYSASYGERIMCESLTLGAPARSRNVVILPDAAATTYSPADLTPPIIIKHSDLSKRASTLDFGDQAGSPKDYQMKYTVVFVEDGATSKDLVNPLKYLAQWKGTTPEDAYDSGSSNQAPLMLLPDEEITLGVYSHPILGGTYLYAQGDNLDHLNGTRKFVAPSQRTHQENPVRRIFEYGHPFGAVPHIFDPGNSNKSGAQIKIRFDVHATSGSSGGTQHHGLWNGYISCHSGSSGMVLDNVVYDNTVTTTGALNVNWAVDGNFIQMYVTGSTIVSFTASNGPANVYTWQGTFDIQDTSFETFF